MSFQLKALREKRGTIKKQLEDLGSKLKAECRAMSADEKAAFDKLKTDWVAVSESVRTAEADIGAIDALMSSAPDAPSTDTPVQNSRVVPGKEDRQHEPGRAEIDADADKRRAFRAWGYAQLGVEISDDDKAACKRAGVNPRQKEFEIKLGDPKTRARRAAQQRALTVTTTGGGYLIPQDYSYELENTLVSYSNVRGVADEFQTETGAALPYPSEDDTGNTGELLAINTEVAYADPSFGSVTFNAYKFSSKGIIVPNELLQDSAFNLDQYLMEQLGVRIGRIQGSYFTTGSGSSQPHGVVTVATAGLTTAGATAITGTELTQLAFSLDPAYRNAPGVGYMMKDDVIGYLLTLKRADGTPLLRESFRDGVTSLMINGFPVYPNQFMTGLTTAAPVSATKHVLFGDFKALKIRDVGGIRLKRLDERWAEKDQVGFIGFLRSDSRCVNTAKIKYLLQA